MSAAGVSTSAAPVAVSLKLASTSADPEAQYLYEQTLPALLFQAAQVQRPIRAPILFTSGRFLALMLKK